MAAGGDWASKDYKPNIALPNVDTSLEALIKNIRPVDVDQRIPLKVGIYGDKGTRKTITAIKLALAALKEKELILYIDSAENWSSILNHKEIDHKRILRYPYQNVESLHTLRREMAAGSHEIFGLIGAVIFDEYSSMVQGDTFFVTEARANELAKSGDKSKDPYMPAWPDYRAVEARFFKVIDGFMKIRPTELSVIFVSHEKFYENEKKIRASMPSATAGDFEKLLHGVYRAEVVKAKRGKEEILSHRLQTQPVGMVSAKTRIGGLGLYCTVDELIEAYKAWGRNDVPKVIPVNDESTDNTNTEK